MKTTRIFGLKVVFVFAAVVLVFSSCAKKNKSFGPDSKISFTGFFDNSGKANNLSLLGSVGGNKSVGVISTQYKSILSELPTPEYLSSGIYKYSNIKYSDYEGEGATTFNLYLPSPANEIDEDLPAVVYIHGGLWNTGDAEEYERYFEYGNEKYADSYVRKYGIPVISMNYRYLGKSDQKLTWDCDYNFADQGTAKGEFDYNLHTDNGNRVIDQVRDVESLFNFVKNNAKILKINPEFAILDGYDSGANLALLYVLSEEYEKPIEIKALINRAGQADMLSSDYPSFFNDMTSKHYDIPIKGYAQYQNTGIQMKDGENSGKVLYASMLSSATGVDYTFDELKNIANGETEIPQNLCDISPLSLAENSNSSNLPYMVMAYGNDSDISFDNNYKWPTFTVNSKLSGDFLSPRASGEKLALTLAEKGSNYIKTKKVAGDVRIAKNDSVADYAFYRANPNQGQMVSFLGSAAGGHNISLVSDDSYESQWTNDERVLLQDLVDYTLKNVCGIQTLSANLWKEEDLIQTEFDPVNSLGLNTKGIDAHDYFIRPESNANYNLKVKEDSDIWYLFSSQLDSTGNASFGGNALSIPSIPATFTVAPLSGSSYIITGLPEEKPADVINNISRSVSNNYNKPIPVHPEYHSIPVKLKDSQSGSVIEGIRADVKGSSSSNGSGYLAENDYVGREINFHTAAPEGLTGLIGRIASYFGYDDLGFPTSKATCVLKRVVETANGPRALVIYEQKGLESTYWDCLPTQRDYEIIANAFLKDGPDNDIYDKLTSFFGSDWANKDSTKNPCYITKDNTITLYFCDIDQVGDPLPGVEYTAGFYDCTNNFKDSWIEETSDCRSDERNMIVLHANVSGKDFLGDCLTTIAHEFQHLLHFQQFRTWKEDPLTSLPTERSSAMNECFSSLAESLCADFISDATGISVSGPFEVADFSRGYIDDEDCEIISRGGYYLSAMDNVGLLNWNSRLTSYGIVASFANWLLVNYGPGVISSYAKGTYLGPDSTLLKDVDLLGLYRAIRHQFTANPSQVGPKALVADWGTACLLSNVSNLNSPYSMNKKGWYTIEGMDIPSVNMHVYNRSDGTGRGFASSNKKTIPVCGGNVAIKVAEDIKAGSTFKGTAPNYPSDYQVFTVIAVPKDVIPAQSNVVTTRDAAKVKIYGGEHYLVINGDVDQNKMLIRARSLTNDGETPADNDKVYWSSNDKNVVKVSNSTATNGEIVVTAVRNGTTSLIARSADNRNIVKSFEVSVSTLATGVDISNNYDSIEVYVGNEIQLCAQAVADKGQIVSDNRVVWSSSNPDVISISNTKPTNNYITAKAVGAGSATLTATAVDGSGKFATCEVSVGSNASSENALIILDVKKGTGVKYIDGIDTMYINGIDSTEISLKGRVVDGKTNIDASNQRILWSLSDPNIAELRINTSTSNKVSNSTNSINDSVKVIARHNGVCSVKASLADGRTFTYKIRIRTLAKYVDIKTDEQNSSIDKFNLSYLGQEAFLFGNAFDYDTDVSDKRVVWEASDPNIISIYSKENNSLSTDGYETYVKAVGYGSATLTAKAVDGSGVKKTIPIDVYAIDPALFNSYKNEAFYSFSSKPFTLSTRDESKHFDGIIYYLSVRNEWRTWGGEQISSLVAPDGKYYIFLKGLENGTITGNNPNGAFNYIANSSVSCEGADVKYLLNTHSMDVGAFAYLFQDASRLVTPPSLSSITTLTPYCYYAMFRNSGIKTTPSIPAQNSAPHACSYMFEGCRNLNAKANIEFLNHLTFNDYNSANCIYKNTRMTPEDGMQIIYYCGSRPASRTYTFTQGSGKNAVNFTSTQNGYDVSYLDMFGTTTLNAKYYDCTKEMTVGDSDGDEGAFLFSLPAHNNTHEPCGCIWIVNARSNSGIKSVHYNSFVTDEQRKKWANEVFNDCLTQFNGMVGSNDWWWPLGDATRVKTQTRSFGGGTLQIRKRFTLGVVTYAYAPGKGNEYKFGLDKKGGAFKISNCTIRNLEVRTAGFDSYRNFGETKECFVLSVNGGSGLNEVNSPKTIEPNISFVFPDYYWVNPVGEVGVVLGKGFANVDGLAINKPSSSIDYMRLIENGYSGTGWKWYWDYGTFTKVASLKD